MIPDDVRNIMTELNNAGFQAYIVGGSVRDVVLGKEPSDFDLATDARPEQVLALFSNTKSTDNSRAHGTVFVNGIDVTTFRTAHDEDGHNAKVKFTDSIFDDTMRRDFTFNGMAMDINGVVSDPFGGTQDLEDKLVRAIGDPWQRMKESYVRMLRACRFMALDPEMTMDRDLYFAINRNRALIHQVPVELIQRELMKMMSYPAPMNGIDAMHLGGLLNEVLPELVQTIGMQQKGCFKHQFNVFYHSLLAMSAIQAEKPLLRFAALLHDIGKPHCHTIGEDGRLHFYSHEEAGAKIAGDIMQRLRFSNSEIDYVTTLVREHMTLSTYYAPTTMRGVRRLLGRLGDVPIEDLLALKSADRFARDGVEKDDSEEENRIRRMVAKIVSESQALKVTDLAIGGNDLIEMGLEPGPLFGQILNRLLEEVLDNEKLNTEEYLMRRAREIIKSKGRNHDEETNLERASKKKTA